MASADRPLFSFADVCVRFADHVVLDHIGFAVPDGPAVTVVLGPSGSGKSTLLRLCNRLEVPTSGTVWFRGEDLSQTEPLSLRRRVGMVFQRPTMFPGTVRENLLVASAGRNDDELAGVLDRCSLGRSFLDRTADDLSGGEQQRVCVARSLAVGPEVVLMDEPTSALDPHSTRGIETLARSLADDGMPVMWVTHDLNQADRIGTHRVVLVDGHVADEHELGHFLAGEDIHHPGSGEPADDR